MAEKEEVVEKLKREFPFFLSEEGEWLVESMAGFAIEYASQQREWVVIRSADDLPKESGQYHCFVQVATRGGELLKAEHLVLDYSNGTWFLDGKALRLSKVHAYLPTPIPEYKREEQK